MFHPMRTYLKNLRKKRGIRQKRISKMLGVSQSYYSLIEQYKRRRNMDLDLLVALSDILEVPPRLHHRTRAFDSAKK